MISSLRSLLCPMIIMILHPALSLDIMMEFSGRPGTLDSPTLISVEEIFFNVYNHYQLDNPKAPVVTKITVDSSGLVSLTPEDFATQPYTLLAQVTCEGCKQDKLFSSQGAVGNKKSPVVFIDDFIGKFNQALSQAGYDVGSNLESLITIKQIADVEECSVEHLEDIIATTEMDLKLTSSEAGPTQDEWDDLAIAFSETYNFLNSVVSAISDRCDKSFHHIKSASVTEAKERRRLQRGLSLDSSLNRMMYWTRLSIVVSSRHHNYIQKRQRRQLLSQTRSVAGGETTVLETSDERFSRRVLAPSKDSLKCKCPVDATLDEPISKEELLTGLRNTMQVLQSEGKLPNIGVLEDIIEPEGGSEEGLLGGP